jgi:hypothetical protein
MEKLYPTSGTRGNADWWTDELQTCGVKFHGADEYDLPIVYVGYYLRPNTPPILCDTKVVITKDGKESPPKDYDVDKAHRSIQRYAYGQMLHGQYYYESGLPSYFYPEDDSTILLTNNKDKVVWTEELNWLTETFGDDLILSPPILARDSDFLSAKPISTTNKYYYVMMMRFMKNITQNLVFATRADSSEGRIYCPTNLLVDNQWKVIWTLELEGLVQKYGNRLILGTLNNGFYNILLQMVGSSVVVDTHVKAQHKTEPSQVATV